MHIWKFVDALQGTNSNYFLGHIAVEKVEEGAQIDLLAYTRVSQMKQEQTLSKDLRRQDIEMKKDETKK